MRYIRRELESKFLKMSGFFKAVLVTGARQVGKTTMLRRLSEGNRAYVSLDDMAVRDIAKSDPKLFFQTYKPPILIDEVQNAPELFSQIKLICDNSDEPGLFWLTGSQQFNMMRRVSETLAGRVGILELYGLSQREKAGVVFEEDLNFTFENVLSRQQKMPKNNITAVFRHIWEGGMPQVFGADEDMREVYLSSYTGTYLMRDVTEAGGITDAVKFNKFLKACASIASGLLNYSTLASAADISVPVAKNWVRVLEGLGIIYLLPPYAANGLKRLTKTPKIYFCDTGLLAYLSMWLTPEALEAGAASGSFYENYVVMELVKNYAYGKHKANLSFYRDSNAKEIDIIIESDNTVHPLEIKKSASPNYRLTKGFSHLDGINKNRGGGGIICMSDAPYPIDEKNIIIPSNLI